MKHEDYLKKCLEDSEFKVEFEALEPEYQLIREMVKARNALGITQEQLAALSGIPLADIGRLENGNANPSLSMLKKLAFGLGKKLEIRFV